MKNSILLFILFIPFLGRAQNNIATDSWRTHYSFNTTISVTQSDKNIYAASKAGLFIINKMDLSISSITKLNGLSETGISVIHHNNTTNTLIIAYDNGQLDLIKKNKITSIPDIRLLDMFNSKVSYHVNEDGIYSFLSTDFGLLKINTESLIIQESFLNLSSTGNNLKILASTIYNDSLFLATETGLMAGNLNENLKDFSKWKHFTLIQGASQEYTNVISLYNEKPITGNFSQGLLVYNKGSWLALGQLIGSEFSTIKTNSNTIITVSGKTFSLIDTLKEVTSAFIVNANDAIDNGLITWVADEQNGVIKIEGISSETLYPNGPFFNEVVKLKSVENKIYAIPEFIAINGQPLRNNAGFSVFENGFWSNFNSTGYPQTELLPPFLDISGVSLKKSGEVVFSSFGYGLLNWSGGKFEIMDETNSPLINSLPPEKNVLIPDLDSDNGSLWVLNNTTTTSLHTLDREDSWTTFMPSNSVSDAKQIISTPWGDQWIAINTAAGGGIIVHSQSSDELILKSSGVGTIPSNNINQMLLDKEDKIWIATSKGVVYYSFPYSIIDDPSQETIVPIINSQLLFNNENVNCLAVDGGNRIWMGTNKGAWLFDNDGSVLIEHFTTENSPLLSDVVNNIAINDKTGEVFFNTASGLISFRGSATITGTYQTPKIFPNPVSPNFTGVITIEGVPTNSKIKITDSSGRLIIELEANGNTAIWDMNNVYSNEVGTGVYFVFIFNSDGSTTQFGKVAIIK